MEELRNRRFSQAVGGSKKREKELPRNLQGKIIPRKK
jgi:hypothetical protein